MKKTTKKLSLRSEVVRSLASEEALLAAGGAINPPTTAGTTACPKTSVCSAHCH